MFFCGRGGIRTPFIYQMCINPRWSSAPHRCAPSICGSFPAVIPRASDVLPYRLCLLGFLSLDFSLIMFISFNLFSLLRLLTQSGAFGCMWWSTVHPPHVYCEVLISLICHFRTLTLARCVCTFNFFVYWESSKAKPIPKCLQS